MKIGMVTKQMFFDRKAIARRVDAAARQVLSRFGAFVRTAARHSIRKRKAISAPGSPPSSHVGLLRRLILFGYDRARRSVVIGPMPLHRGSDAPHLLEYGGRAQRTDRRGRRRTARYRARPYMGPALARERPKLPAMWANSVKA